MPVSRKPRGGRVLILGCLCIFTLLVLSVGAFAQDEETPKYEIFAGYQWLHPGATVPTPFQPATAPIPQTLRDMGDGAGGSFTYNFAKYVGLVGDYGRNWTELTSEQTVSVG